MAKCKSIGCFEEAAENSDFCIACIEQTAYATNCAAELEQGNMSARYPAYYKDVSDLTEVDVYAVHNLFQINDPSGCIHHASKKLLLSGARTGGKSQFKDIKEARDSLTRWLQLNETNQGK